MRLDLKDTRDRSETIFTDSFQENYRRLVSYVHDRITSVVLVTGTRGIGKTELVRSLIPRGVPPGFEVEWLDLVNSPDPISEVNAAIEIIKNEPIAQTRGTPRWLIVVLDSAEGLRGVALAEAVYKLRNWKRVRKVIVTTQYRERGIRGAREIHLSLPAGRLYTLRDQVLVAQNKIIPTLAPKIITANNALIVALKKKPLDLFKITPRQFEEVIADLLEGMGMEVELTPATRDGGKDILAYMDTPLGKLLTLVETKQFNKNRPVGVSLVRTLFGTLVDHKATNGMLVTTSRFAKPAQEFQERHKYQLELKDYEDVVGWLMKHKL